MRHADDRAGRIRWAAGAWAPLLAAACVTADDAPAAANASAAAATAAAALAHDANAPIAAVESKPPVIYSFAGKRDPFRSYLADEHERERAAHEGRPQEATEAFDTAQFRLTAILQGREPSAMVEDPSGRGHIVRLGARIGKNEGRIVRIDRHGVAIVEQLLDGTGKLMEVPVTLALPNETETTQTP